MSTETDKARKLLRDAIGDDTNTRREHTPILYPFSGVSETYGFSNQEAGTSRDERNMRSFDPQTGRLRGSQRAGLGKYGDGQAIVASTKVSGLASVMREINPYTWTEGVSLRFKTPGNLGSLNCTDLRRDFFGTYYALGQKGDVQRINSDGGVIDSFDAAHYAGEPDDDTDITLHATTIAIDQFQHCFVATGHGTGASSELLSMIHLYEHRADGSYERAWTIHPNMFVLDMYVYGLDLFVWGVVDNGNGAATYKLKRYPEYEFVEEPAEDSASAYSHTPAASTLHTHATADDRHVGRMDVDTDGTVYATMSRYIGVAPTGGGGGAMGDLVHAGIWKLRPISANAGTAIWKSFYNKDDDYASGTEDVQGYGLGVIIGEKVDDETDVTHGQPQIWLWGGANSNSSLTDTQPRIRLVRDDPDLGPQWAFSQDLYLLSVGYKATAGWFEQGIGTLDNLHMRGCRDEEGVVYIPYGMADDASEYSEARFLAVSSNGTALNVELAPTTVTPNGSDMARVISIAVPMLRPTYDDASQVNTADLAVLGGSNDSVGQIVHGVDLAAYAAEADLREIRTLAFIGGEVWKLNTSSAPTQVTTPDGSNASYDESLQYVQATSGAGHIYFSDGMRYWDYNPATEKVSRLLSDTVGPIPGRARLITFWRNRLVLARSDNLPGTWHMSRAGDVHDWDQFPQTPDAHQAVSGTTGPAGLCPDSINAVIAHTDDLLWFGCDSSIWQLSGDPTSAVFDMVTDEVGISFGQPYCRDEVGRLWFFSSKGGLYVWDGSLRDVSKGRIRRRLQDIDLGANFVRLVYNYADDGIHIFVCPFGAASAEPRDHYFYDKRTESFHIDKFGASGNYIEPTAALVVDGDAPADRAILLGSGNGHVFRWGSGEAGVIPRSDQMSNSNTAPIDSYVLIGPIADVHDMSAAAMSELAAVLAPNYSGVFVEIFSTDTPDSLGDPVWRGTLHAGRNATQLVRVTGDSIYIRLRNGALDEHWALEKCSAILSYGGQIRSRT